MRILFSSSPAFGHLLPMMPLALAARRSGHEVAFLTSRDMTDAVRPMPVLPAGVSFEAMFAEAATRRPGQAVTDFTPQMLVEGFVNVRLDLGGEEALTHARSFRPELVIAEEADFLGLLIAAELKVPWVSHKLGTELPPPISGALGDAFAAQMKSRGPTASPRVAVLNLWPDALQPEGWRAPPDELTIHPQPFEQEGAAWTPPTFPGREDRPLVLVTLGTVVGDMDVLTGLIAV